MKKGLITILIASVLFVTACNKAKKENIEDISQLKPDSIILTIDKARYSKADFDEAFNKLYVSSPFGASKTDLSLKRNTKLKLLFRAKAINDIIIRHFIEEEAKNSNLTVSNDEVENIYNEIVEKMGSEERLLNQLKVASMDKEDFKKSLKADIMAKKLIDKMSKDLTITDEDVKQYYDEHKFDKFKVPETARASHIFIKADPRVLKKEIRQETPGLSDEEATKKVNDKMAEARKKAVTILKEAVNTPDNFKDLADKHSEDRISAPQGGDLGYFPKGKMLKAFNDVVFDPDKVQVSKVYGEVVQSPIGFHIIKLTDHRKEGILSFDTVKDDIKRILSDAKKVELLTNFVNKKKANSKIDYIYEEFDQKYINEQLGKDNVSPADQATADIKPESNNNEDKEG